jgi:hypothetical protein
MIENVVIHRPHFKDLKDFEVIQFLSKSTDEIENCKSRDEIAQSVPFLYLFILKPQ